MFCVRNKLGMKALSFVERYLIQYLRMSSIKGFTVYSCLLTSSVSCSHLVFTGGIKEIGLMTLTRLVCM